MCLSSAEVIKKCRGRDTNSKFKSYKHIENLNLMDLKILSGIPANTKMLMGEGLLTIGDSAC